MSYFRGFSARFDKMHSLHRLTGQMRHSWRIDSIQAVHMCVSFRFQISFVLRVWIRKKQGCGALRICNISSLMVTSHCNTEGEREGWDEGWLRTRAWRRMGRKEELKEQTELGTGCNQVGSFTTPSWGGACLCICTLYNLGKRKCIPHFYPSPD